jgi:hypothetical protein
LIFLSTFLPLQLTGDLLSDVMVTITNRRKVLIIEGKVKLLGEIGNEKKKADVFGEFGLVIRQSNRFEKTETELLVCLNRTDIRIK